LISIMIVSRGLSPEDRASGLQGADPVSRMRRGQPPTGSTRYFLRMPPAWRAKSMKRTVSA